MRTTMCEVKARTCGMRAAPKARPALADSVRPRDVATPMLRRQASSRAVIAATTAPTQSRLRIPGQVVTK